MVCRGKRCLYTKRLAKKREKITTVVPGLWALDGFFVSLLSTSVCVKTFLRNRMRNGVMRIVSLSAECMVLSLPFLGTGVRPLWRLSLQLTAGMESERSLVRERDFELGRAEIRSTRFFSSVSRLVKDVLLACELPVRTIIIGLEDLNKKMTIF